MNLKTYKIRREDVLSPQTLKKHLIVLEELDRFLKERGKKEPTEQDVHEFFDMLKEKGVKPASLKRYYYVIKAYVEMVLGQYDSLRGVGKRFKGISRREQTLTKEEVKRIFEAEVNPRQKAIYALLYEYARRIGEVLALKRRDINLEEGKITFPILKRKESKSERVTFKLGDFSRKYLEEYFNWLKENKVELKPDDFVFPVTERAVNIALGKTAQRAGIKYDVTAHWFRHARVTHLRMAGVHDKVIQERVTLHRSLKTLQEVYLHSFPFEAEEIPSAEETLKT